MKERREISSTRDLINILDSAEINAKEVQAVKDEVGYSDSNFPDAEGNTTTLTQYIHNYTQSLKDQLTELRAEIKEETQKYVKEQCTRTHVLVERETLKSLASSCSHARDNADSVEYDAEETENYARSIGNSLSDCKESIEYVEDDLHQLAEQNMPVEAMEASRPAAKKAPAKKSGDSNE